MIGLFSQMKVKVDKELLRNCIPGLSRIPDSGVSLALSASRCRAIPVARATAA